MLQAIRSKAGSLVVKLLFAFLIISFGVWGIGDIFRTRSSEVVVATVGGTKVRAEEVQNAARRERERLRRAFGVTPDIEQLKQFGFVESVVDGIITRDLLDLEAERLRLAVGEDGVYRAVTANPAFRTAGGQFDPALYSRVLSDNQLSKQQYEAQLLRELPRTHLVEAVTDGAAAPRELIAALVRSRGEKRVADTVFLPIDTVPEAAEPSADDVAAWYEQHQEQFRTPERRTFTVAALRVEDVASRMEVPEDRLRDEYQQRLGEFGTPEKRQLEQILFADEAKAKEAAAELAAGKDFYEVAKSVAGADEESVKLGSVERKDLPPSIADAAFDLKENQPSEPIKDPLGWHILRVTAIEPGHVETFEAVKDQLAGDIAKERAADEIFRLSNEVDDALAGGATLDEVAKKFGLALATATAVDVDGHDAAAKAAELPVAPAEVLRTAFATPQGQTTRLTETSDNNFYAVQVAAVTASAVPPLDQVRERAAASLKAEQRDAALQEKAKALAEQVAGEKTLIAVAGETGLPATTTKPFSRNGSEAAIPPSLAAQLFTVKPGDLATAPIKGGVWLGQLKSVEQPEPKPGDPQYEAVARQLRDAMRNDVGAEFQKALRSRYPVTIDQAELKRVL